VGDLAQKPPQKHKPRVSFTANEVMGGILRQAGCKPAGRAMGTIPGQGRAANSSLARPTDPTARTSAAWSVGARTNAARNRSVRPPEQAKIFAQGGPARSAHRGGKALFAFGLRPLAIRLRRASGLRRRRAPEIGMCRQGRARLTTGSKCCRTARQIFFSTDNPSLHQQCDRARPLPPTGGVRDVTDQANPTS